MYQYIASIEHIGEQALDALKDRMMILFGLNAPQEVKDYCFVIRNYSHLNSSINLDSTLLIGDHAYIITAVGDVANHNLATLGHVTLKFDGSIQPELPGTIHLLGPTLSKIQCGDIIIFG